MNMNRKLILLVDDKQDVLLTLAEGLRATGEFEILTAENGKRALELFGTGIKMDLLVTDLEMPEMNGFELLAHVKKNYPATPAMVLTGAVTHKTKEQLKAIGDYTCIEKPVGLGELRRIIIDELRIHSKPGEKKA